MLRIFLAALIAVVLGVGAHAAPADLDRARPERRHRLSGELAASAAARHRVARRRDREGDQQRRQLCVRSADRHDEHREETRFIYHRGLLPDGETLTGLLDDAGKRDYAPRPGDGGNGCQRAMDQKQPWRAEVVLTVQSMYRRNYTAVNAPEGDAHDVAGMAGRTSAISIRRASNWNSLRAQIRSATSTSSAPSLPTSRTRRSASSASSMPGSRVMSRRPQR